MSPITGDIVTCEECGAPYRYFRWAFGSDRCYCKSCLSRHRVSYDDEIDLNKEQDMIMTENHERHLKDFPKKK